MKCLAMAVLLATSPYVLAGPQVQNETARITAPTPVTNEFFGSSVAIENGRIAAGIQFSVAAGAMEGAARTFTGSGSSWTDELLYIPIPTSSHFGSATALYEDPVLDKTTWVVGARKSPAPLPDQGRVHVAVRSGASWVIEDTFTGSDSLTARGVGTSVAIEGDRIVTGAPITDDMLGGISIGAAYVFERTGTTWAETQKLSPEAGVLESSFGQSVDLEGDRLIVGAPYEASTSPLLFDTGAVHVFEHVGGTWTRTATLRSDTLIEGALLGSSVALSGNTIAAGAAGDSTSASGGTTYVFTFDGTNWNQEAALFPSDPVAGPIAFGTSVDLQGDTLVASAETFVEPGDTQQTGTAWVFRRSGTTWSQGEKLQASLTPSEFLEVELEDDASSVVCGAPNVGGGAVYYFELAGAPDPVGADACSGDGGDQLGCSDCPCMNEAPAGTVGGCLNSAGTSTRLLASGSASIGAADLRFEAQGAPPTSTAVLTSGNSLAPANMTNPCFGLDSGIQAMQLDGLRCVVQGVLRHGVRPSDSAGDIGVTTNGWGSPNGFFNFSAFVAGSTKHFQLIYRDDELAVCMRGQNTSQAVTVVFVP